MLLSFVSLNLSRIFFSHIHPPTASVNLLKHGNYGKGQVSPKGVAFVPNVTPVTFVELENGSLDSDPSSPSSSLFHPALTPAPPSCKCYPPGECCPAIFHANPMLSCSFVLTLSDKSMLPAPLRPTTGRCEDAAQLLLEGMKGEELAAAVERLDRMRSTTLLTYIALLPFPCRAPSLLLSLICPS